MRPTSLLPLACALVGCSAEPELESTNLIYDHIAYLASPETAGRKPGTAGNELALAYVEERFAEMGLEAIGDDGTYRQHFTNPRSRWDEGVAETTSNIVGLLPGATDEVVLISAHIDHDGATEEGAIFAGADDDASGVAAMIELARRMTMTGVPRQTYLFVAFNMEEWGLYGSEHFCNNPLVPLDTIMLMMSIDMVGGGSGEGLELFANTDALWYAQMMQSLTERDALAGSVRHRWRSPGDTMWFAEAEVPVVHATTMGAHPHYHTVDDTPENINLDDLDVAFRLIWATTEELSH